MHVFGHEHYAEHLETLACAGVPIHHPISGKTVGAVDLTCWRRDAGSLLLTLAKSTAEQIRQQLLADAGTRELRAVPASTCGPAGAAPAIVFAVDSDVVDDERPGPRPCSTRPTRPRCSATARTRWPAAGPAGWRSQLPTGATARMMLRPVTGSSGGGVVQVKIVPPADSPAGEPRRPRRRAGPAARPGRLRRRCGCGPATRSSGRTGSGEWIAVEGEPGVGKAAVLRAVQLRRQPVGRFAVLDAAEADNPGWLDDLRRTVLVEADSVVLRHVDTLDGPRLRAVAAILQEASGCRPGPGWRSRVDTASAPGRAARS